MNKTKEAWLARLRRASRGLAGASDLVASAFGTYLRQWLRFFWYGVVGLCAGALLDDPYRIAGIVLGVAFVAEFSLALATEFIDWKEALVWAWVICWWPFRHQVGNASPIGGGAVPTDSRRAAAEWLREKVK